MHLDILPIGLYEENSYVLHQNKHVLFVDPGRYAKEIASKTEKDETVDGIVLTHGHEDHTGAVDDLVDLYHCRVYISQKDLDLIDPANARKIGFSAPVYSEVTPYPQGDSEITVGTFPLKIIETPGHTEGSVCIQYRSILFTGDTLFAGSIGRTDLYSGNEKEMYESLYKLSRMPGYLQVFPGHGPSTTITHELQINPYFYQFNH